MSYVRLFALGLSGGILAGVFNSLAVGMSPDNVIAVSYTHLDVYKRQRGNYSAEELTEYISILREGGEISPKEFPVYLSTFITDYLNTPAESTKMCIRDRSNTYPTCR